MTAVRPTAEWEESRLGPYGETQDGDVVRAITDPGGHVRVDLPHSWSVGAFRLRAVSADGALGSPGFVGARVGEAVTIEVMEAAVVSGRVVGLGTGEWERVRVLVSTFRPAEGAGLQSLSVDPDGRFRLGGVHGGVSFKAVAPGRVPSALRSVTPDGPGERNTIELELGPAAVTARLRVVGPDGEPVRPAPSINVCAMYASADGDDPTYSGGRTFFADADGVVHLEGIHPAATTVIFVRPRRDAASGRWEFMDDRVEFAPGKLAGTPTIRLRPVAQTRFRLTDAAGRPLQGVRVAVRRSEPATDSDGTAVVVIGARDGVTAEDGIVAPFDAYPHPPGHYTLDLRGCPGSEYLWRGVAGMDGGRVVDVSLGDRAVLRIHAADAFGATVPVANAWVSIVDVDAPPPENVDSYRDSWGAWLGAAAPVTLVAPRASGPSGALRVIYRIWTYEDHPPGPGPQHVVPVRRDAGAVRVIVPRDARGLRAMSLALKPDDGRPVDPGGSPTEALARGFHGVEGTVCSMGAPEDGSAVFRGIAPGTYWWHVAIGPLGLHRGPAHGRGLVVLPGATVDLDLTGEPGSPR